MTSTKRDDDIKHEILKVDSRGRVQVSLDRREALLEEFDRSGMTGAAFARHYGIKYTTFAYWVQYRRKCQRRETAKHQPQFLTIETPCDDPGVEGTIAVDLPNRCKVVSIRTRKEAELAASLINALGSGK